MNPDDGQDSNTYRLHFQCDNVHVFRIISSYLAGLNIRVIQYENLFLFSEARF